MMRGRVTLLIRLLFLQASLIPITKGVTPEKAQQGIWTTKAEVHPFHIHTYQ